MLTRLKVNGFKNLVNVDVRFGPFTCIAGANGVGKSNLFDAIRFLSALAEMPILDAALSIRGGTKASDIRDLFTRIDNDHMRTMSFEAEIVIPKFDRTKFGTVSEIPATHFIYVLELEYTGAKHHLDQPIIVNKYESLVSITPHADFPFREEWSQSAFEASSPRKILEHQGNEYTLNDIWDSEARGHSSTVIGNWERTFLSVQFYDTPNLTFARSQIASWLALQLEPSALRQYSEYMIAPPQLTENGSNLPALVNRIARSTDDPEQIFSQFSNRLSQLINDVRDVYVDQDEGRERLTLMLKDKSGATYPARSLSDGTLRFLAMIALEMDTTNTGVYCIEEPENGLHPARIPAMLDVLQGIAVDTDDVVDEVNPLRQVIINTHSPAVVQQVPDDSLLLAYNVEQEIEGNRISTVQFRGLENTWRKDERPIARGDLLSYLNPVAYSQDELSTPHNRVIDRQDLIELKYPPRVEDE